MAEFVDYSVKKVPKNLRNCNIKKPNELNCLVQSECFENMPPLRADMWPFHKKQQNKEQNDKDKTTQDCSEMVQKYQPPDMNDVNIQLLICFLRDMEDANLDPEERRAKRALRKANKAAGIEEEISPVKYKYISPEFFELINRKSPEYDEFLRKMNVRLSDSVNYEPDMLRHFLHAMEDYVANKGYDDIYNMKSKDRSSADSINDEELLNFLAKKKNDLYKKIELQKGTTDLSPFEKQLLLNDLDAAFNAQKGVKASKSLENLIEKARNGKENLTPAELDRLLKVTRDTLNLPPDKKELYDRIASKKGKANLSLAERKQLADDVKSAINSGKNVKTSKSLEKLIKKAKDGKEKLSPNELQRLKDISSTAKDPPPEKKKFYDKIETQHGNVNISPLEMKSLANDAEAALNSQKDLKPSKSLEMLIQKAKDGKEKLTPAELERLAQISQDHKNLPPQKSQLYDKIQSKNGNINLDPSELKSLAQDAQAAMKSKSGTKDMKVSRSFEALLNKAKSGKKKLTPEETLRLAKVARNPKHQLRVLKNLDPNSLKSIKNEIKGKKKHNFKTKAQYVLPPDDVARLFGRLSKKKKLSPQDINEVVAFLQNGAILEPAEFLQYLQMINDLSGLTPEILKSLKHILLTTYTGLSNTQIKMILDALNSMDMQLKGIKKIRNLPYEDMYDIADSAKQTTDLYRQKSKDGSEYRSSIRRSVTEGKGYHPPIDNTTPLPVQDFKTFNIIADFNKKNRDTRLDQLSHVYFDLMKSAKKVKTKL